MDSAEIVTSPPGLPPAATLLTHNRRRLANARRLHRSEGGYRLTDAGRQVAREVVRTHRLWETYLSRQLGMPADHLHLSASRLEHLRDRAVQEQLTAETGEPVKDPHGRRLPGA